MSQILEMDVRYKLTVETRWKLCNGLIEKLDRLKCFIEDNAPIQVKVDITGPDYITHYFSDLSYETKTKIMEFFNTEEFPCMMSEP